MMGKVKFFDVERRFGFVQNEGGEWFFHEDQVVGELPNRADEVEFWLDDNLRRGGLVAAEVRVIKNGEVDASERR